MKLRPEKQSEGRINKQIGKTKATKSKNYSEKSAVKTATNYSTISTKKPLGTRLFQVYPLIELEEA